ncbi:hypothetical protein [Limosilactobacillus agrestimuris]|uniref:hypothetical protein n=1 Tax=Limosilactobacillus agrestimuris TaxID=2941331 RepID=UPI00203E3BA9|nr:hypothetical protein [Limosilactobacillus agrestimuris]
MMALLKHSHFILSISNFNLAKIIAGTDLTNIASKFLQNGDTLLKGGATVSWANDVPTANQQDGSGFYSIIWDD